MPVTFRKLRATCPLVLSLLLPALTRAETAVQAWVQRYNGPGNDWDQANAVAVDGSNNIIVAGYSWGSGSRYDYATIKYSSAGVPLWTNRYNGPANGHDVATALAVDSSDNVIVTGYSTNNGSGDDYATIKYSSAGVALWTNRYNGPGNGHDWAVGVAVDRSNNVIVTGRSDVSAGWFNWDYATIKYSSAGVALWTNRYNGPGNNSDEARAVAVDGSNNVIVTGYSIGSEGTAAYTTIQYSSAGVALWTNRYSGPGIGDDRAAGLAVDRSNNVIVTGCSISANGYAYYDFATIKYSSAGVPLWTNRCDGSRSRYDSPYILPVDSGNNVIVTGYSDVSGYGTNDDYVTIKYSSAGVPLWTNRYNGSDNGYDHAWAVAIDGSDNVIVAGSSQSSGGDSDYATIKYSSAGVPLWTSRYNGPGNGDDGATGVAVDRSNNVIVMGNSGGDFVTVKYLCVPSPVMSNLSGTNGTFQMRVDEVLQPGTLVIEASTNLAGWAPVFTNTTPTNVVFYTDPDASNAPTRFYRAFQFP
jgi:hypothetical protein